MTAVTEKKTTTNENKKKHWKMGVETTKKTYNETEIYQTKLHVLFDMKIMADVVALVAC